MEWVGFEPTIPSAKDSREISRSLLVKVPRMTRMSARSTHSIIHTHNENMHYKHVLYCSPWELKISQHATHWRGCWDTLLHCWTDASCEELTQVSSPGKYWVHKNLPTRWEVTSRVIVTRARWRSTMTMTMSQYEYHGLRTETRDCICPCPPMRCRCRDSDSDSDSAAVSCDRRSEIQSTVTRRDAAWPWINPWMNRGKPKAHPGEGRFESCYFSAVWKCFF